MKGELKKLKDLEVLQSGKDSNSNVENVVE